jgi:hypothetical protein
MMSGAGALHRKTKSVAQSLISGQTIRTGSAAALNGVRIKSGSTRVGRPGHLSCHWRSAPSGLALGQAGSCLGPGAQPQRNSSLESLGWVYSVRPLGAKTGITA